MTERDAMSQLRELEPGQFFCIWSCLTLRVTLIRTGDWVAASLNDLPKCVSTHSAIRYTVSRDWTPDTTLRAETEHQIRALRATNGTLSCEVQQRPSNQPKTRRVSSPISRLG